MYRNFREQSFSSDGSGTPRGGPPDPSTSTSEQQQHKFPVSGAGEFVPSLNTITSSQDLQWLVQPTLMPPTSLPRLPQPPYTHPPGPHSLPRHSSQPHLLRQGVIRAAGGVEGTTRRRNDDYLSQEDLERRRIRRERNKLAAAKCRNRRRELTDTLQNETDLLENDKTRLQKEIAELEKEKEKLELVLEAHRPICKIPDSDSDSDSGLEPLTLGAIKIEPTNPDLPGPSWKCQQKSKKPKPKIKIPSLAPSLASSSSSTVPDDSGSLHTPILIPTPSLTPFTASLVFTYPSAPLDTNAVAAPQHRLSPVPSSSSQHSQRPEPCGVAHRRSSSSGDQSSDHSLNSPTILI